MRCCREVLGKSVVGKCACVWGSGDCRGVLKECCEGVLWKSGEVLYTSGGGELLQGRVVKKCCGEVLWRSVVEKCCEGAVKWCRDVVWGSVV